MNHEFGKKTALGIVSVLLLLSMGGGFLLLPFLVPFHIWAARRSAALGRVSWSVFPVAATGMVAWAAVYLTVGETKPWIWLIPAASAAIAVVAMVRLTGEDLRLPAEPSPS